MATSSRRPRISRAANTWAAVGARGIKSIRNSINIEIAPLTILAGANSSGKSSIMQPMLMIKQTLEAPYDPGPLLINGANTSFSSVAEMLWHAPGDNPASVLSASYLSQNGEHITLDFKAAVKGLSLTKMSIERGAERHVLTPSSSQAQLRAAVPQMYQELLKSPSFSDGLEIKRARSFYQIEVKGVPVPLLLENGFQTAATGMLHLPGLRGVPERFYPASEVGEVFPGVFQPYVASVIAAWGNTADARLPEVGAQLAHLGLSWKVQAKRIDDTRVALRVGRLPRPRRGGAVDLVNIADVGLGVSQTLPVLVALLAARRGQIVYLEQPEIHLHPRAQVALARILVDAALRGVLVVAETHSNLLLKGIQEQAALGEIPSSLIRLHWFSRDENGATIVSSGSLDENGAFGDWPVDFGDVELDIEDRYLDAVDN